MSARMTPEQAVKDLAEIEKFASADPEGAHDLADKVLRAVVPAEVAEAYRRVMEAAPWWACS